MARREHGRLALRSVTPDDGEMLRAWRNDPDAVRFSVSGSPVTEDQHREWMQRVLDEPTVVQWIAEVDGAPVGQVRVDIADSSGTVSVGVAPDQRGQGYATAMLRALQSEVRSGGHMQELRAIVHRGNAASMRAFLSAGFDERGTQGKHFIELGWSARE